MISALVKTLTSEGVSKAGGRQKWKTSVVQSFLINVKFKGDVFLQIPLGTDCLIKKWRSIRGKAI